MLTTSRNTLLFKETSTSSFFSITVVYVIDKHMVDVKTCFIAVIKHGYEFGCISIKSRVRYPYCITAIKHGYRCFISILTRPYQCAALVFFLKRTLTGCHLVDCSLDPNRISFQTLIKLIA